MYGLRLYRQRMTSKQGFVDSSNWLHHLDCSGISGSPPPYQTFDDGSRKPGAYGATTSTPGHPKSTSLIFCVHGNKYGVARCCDDLHAGSNEDEANRGQGFGQSYLSEAGHTTGSSGSKSV